MTTSCTDLTHPYYREISGFDGRETLDFFTEDPNRMRHVSLGQLLDFTSFGGMNYVVWRQGRKDLIGLVNKWMRSQKPRRELKRIPISEDGKTYRVEEKSREYDYLWNRFENSFEKELPFIHHDSCPVSDSHQETVRDTAGRIRCSSKGQNDDFCYSVISDKGIYLPLETVLSRLEVTHAFSGKIGSFSVFPFSGFTLANHVEAWWNQEGRKKFYNPGGRSDPHKVYGQFTPASSEC